MVFVYQNDCSVIQTCWSRHPSPNPRKGKEKNWVVAERTWFNLSIKKQLYVLISVLSPIFSFLFYIVCIINWKEPWFIVCIQYCSQCCACTILAGLKIDQQAKILWLQHVRFAVWPKKLKLCDTVYVLQVFIPLNTVAEFGGSTYLSEFAYLFSVNSYCFTWKTQQKVDPKVKHVTTRGE